MKTLKFILLLGIAMPLFLFASMFVAGFNELAISRKLKKRKAAIRARFANTTALTWGR